MAHLSLSLLGAFHAQLDGKPVDGFRSDKARALLAYLAVEQQPHTRAHLAGLLWPDWPETAARTYLRQALAHYQQHRERVATELGMAPEVETVQLAESIQQGAWPVSHPDTMVQHQPARPPDVPPLPEFLKVAAPAHRRTPPFVARAEELANLRTHLARALAGEGRIVFIRGDAGSGKTSRLREFARRAHQSHSQLLSIMGGFQRAYGKWRPLPGFSRDPAWIDR